MDPDKLLHAATREALDVLALDYLARPDLDSDAFFADLRRQIESRAQTLKMVREKGPMGGGGADEA